MADGAIVTKLTGNRSMTFKNANNVAVAFASNFLEGRQVFIILVRNRRNEGIAL